MTDATENTPSAHTNAIQGTVSREEIDGPDDTLGAVFPMTPDGVDFLEENNAWGFVTIAREPEFAAMYVSGTAKEVRYFARVESVVDADEAKLAQPGEEYPRFESGKKVVVFEPESLHELEDPIPYRERIPYSLRYTDLGRFRSATGTDDLF